MERCAGGAGRLRKAARIALVGAAICAAVVSVAAVAAFLLFFGWSSGIGTVLSRLVVSDSRLPLAITVFGRSTDNAGNDTLSARIDLFTADGDLAGTVERSWSGWELKIDCVMIGTGSGWLVFPFVAYTDGTTRGRGMDLLRLYERDGFPAIFESTLLRKDERASLRRLFSLVGTERWMPSFLGSLHHETVSIRSFEAGTEYSLFATKEGKLLLRAN